MTVFVFAVQAQSCHSSTSTLQTPGLVLVADLIFWFIVLSGCCNIKVWSKEKGYAKILEYKKKKNIVRCYDGNKILFEVETEPFDIPTGFKSGGIVIPESKEEYKLPEYLKNKPMKKVIRLDEPKEEIKEPVQFTHYFNSREWEKESFTGEEYEKIVYLGYDNLEGDMFACYINKGIVICKGHLNDGVY